MKKQRPNKDAQRDLLLEIACELMSLFLSIVFGLIVVFVLFALLWPILEFFNLL